MGYIIGCSKWSGRETQIKRVLELLHSRRGVHPKKYNVHQIGESFPHDKNEEREKDIQSHEVISCK